MKMQQQNMGYAKCRNNSWIIQEASYLAWRFRDYSTHSPWGIIATIKSSMGALPGCTSVNTGNSCLNKTQKQHQRYKRNGSPASHCFHRSLLNYEGAARDGDLGKWGVCGECRVWTAIYGGEKGITLTQKKERERERERPNYNQPWLVLNLDSSWLSHFFLFPALAVTLRICLKLLILLMYQIPKYINKSYLLFMIVIIQYIFMCLNFFLI